MVRDYRDWGQRSILGVILEVGCLILDFLWLVNHFGLVVQVERFMLAFDYPWKVGWWG